MSLQSGTRLGAYEVVSLLGAGGMGEVYRARDTRLGRDVAIKILSPRIAADRDSVLRFEREARALATLNHPNIAAIYDVVESTGQPALVLELVDGQTVADRIAAGPLSIGEAIGYAKQIADALDVAHEAGIVHRDLKPGNIKVTEDGRIKVLDFGLAKAIAAAAGEVSEAEPANSPTITVHGTRQGVILGTAAYMSPEQARGKRIDKRTDIWAFGCVLYEMLTRRPAFAGETTSDVIAAIIERAPDLSLLPRATPPHVRRVIARCLEKDPKRRIRDIADVSFDLNDAAIASPIASAAARRLRPIAFVVAGSAAAAIIAAFVAAWPAQRGTPSSAPVQFSLSLPETIGFNGTVPRIAVSPDGRYIAIVANSLMFDNASIWVRSLDAPEFEPLQGTDGATYPFWSPDSRFIAFVAGGKVMRVPVTGGPATTVCETSGTNLGIAWSPTNEIVFGGGPGGGGLRRVPASGGAPEPFTTLDPGRDELDHRWPTILPDGRHVLFLAVGKIETMLKVASLDSADVSLVGPIESSVAYASGRLVSLRCRKPRDAGV